MRLALVGLLLCAGFAGCTGGEPGRMTPTCPNWTEGPAPFLTFTDNQFYRPGNALHATATFPIDGREPADQDGKKVDRYRLASAFHVDNGTLEVRALRNDTQTPLQLYTLADPKHGQTVVTVGPGRTQEIEWFVDLGPHTQAPKPTALTLQFDFHPFGGMNPGTGRTGGPRVGAEFTVSAFALYRAPGCVAVG